MSGMTYYQGNRDVILNRAKYHYENNKERLRELAKNKYRNLSEEDKNKKKEYGKNRYHNMSEEKKQKLKEYQKNYREVKKSQYNNKQNSFLIVILINKTVFSLKFNSTCYYFSFTLLNPYIYVILDRPTEIKA